MGKLNIRRVLDCFSPWSGCSSSCFCINSMADQDQDQDHDDDDDQYYDKKPLIQSDKDHSLRTDQKQTLAFQLKPKMVVLKVSIHCKGCARKVEKHISKMEGVTSYKVDLETKMVMIIGDILPYEVLESVSKVKNAQLWQSSPPI